MKNYPLWTAIVTPMLPDGQIDYDSFEQLLGEQEKAGIGVLILGSTGEGLNLTDAEKREMVFFAHSMNLKVPLMVGIGGYQLKAQIDFMHFVDQIGVDAFLLVTPLYAKPGKEGQYEWFKALMESTNTSCMLYNVPSRTGVKLDPSVPARINAEFDNLFGVKEASGSMQEFKIFRSAAPEVDFYSGDDGLMEAFVKEGALGLVSVASNVWPMQTMKMVQLCLEGRNNELYSSWKGATDALFAASNPVPVKMLLHHNEWIAHKTVRPPISLNDMTDQAKNNLISAEEGLNDWYRNFN